MSFRTAYSDFKSGKRSSYSNRTPALIRDKTPEEEKKMMDDYYIRMRKLSPSSYSRYQKVL